MLERTILKEAYCYFDHTGIQGTTTNHRLKATSAEVSATVCPEMEYVNSHV